MDNFVTISNTRDNVLEFDLDIQGLPADDMKVRFVIHADKVCFMFPCSKEEKKWSVLIPQLSYLERTAFPFCIEIVADGYFFEALRGTINVVGSAEIYVTSPKNTATPPQQPPTDGEVTIVVPESKTTEKKSAPKEKAKPLRSRERSIAMIAEELMKSQRVENVESVSTNPKDQKVRNILEESKKASSKKESISKD